MTNPFPLVEMAVKELLEEGYEPAQGRTGGDLAYEYGQPLYVWLGLMPGGRTTRVDGLWIVDIDCFASNYAEAMQAALDLEALLVDRNHVTSVMRLDRCTQNEGPAERPWEDENVFRIGATYTFTARRTG